MTYGSSPAIRILGYRSDWPAQFRRLARGIWQAAPAASIIHHIGSTAVPGLAAKDVIDIQLTVGSLAEVDSSALRAAGFEPVHGLADHAPPGARLDAADLAKLFFRSTTRPANLHVREHGRFNQRYALLCRDFLVSHPDAAKAYETIKRRLAARFPNDVDAYYDIKDPVFDLIMAGAEEWAARTAWREPKPDFSGADFSGE
ncbi:GrpB family protein [Roseococcus sp.]|uniref:GrpB family protein n=1 Tax=Roseococcus sp. TaxID=2109646 RepID=UPI003BAD638C